MPHAAHRHAPAHRAVRQHGGRRSDDAAASGLTDGGSALLSTGRKGPRAPVGDVLPVVAAKLLLHPLLVYALGRAAIAMGLPLTDAALTVIVLVAALPSASNVSMLAERFGADNGRIARIILWTTVAAFVTFTLAGRWLV